MNIEMNIEKSLSEYGLNKREIDVYLSLLELGASSVTTIANKSKIQRTTTYHVLKTLKEKGLIGIIKKDNKTFFEAAHPSKFIASLKEKETNIRKILPKLINLKESAIKKPEMTLYEGRIGVSSLFEDILNDKKDFVAYASTEALEKGLSFSFYSFTKKRIKLKIKAKLILDKAPPVKKHTEYRILNKKFNTSTVIYGNKIAIFSLNKKEPIGIILEDKEIADTQRMVFETMWRVAKKV